MFCDYGSTNGDVIEACSGLYETYYWGFRPGGVVPPAKMLIGTWLGSMGGDPKCEALPCAPYTVPGADKPCTGNAGDFCFPVPASSTDMCYGYLKCDPETLTFTP